MKAFCCREGATDEAVRCVLARTTDLYTPRTANPPRVMPEACCQKADARGGDPTVESLDLSRPHPKKVKAEHWPHQIAAAWARVGDARRALPAFSRSFEKGSLIGYSASANQRSVLSFGNLRVFYLFPLRKATCDLIVDPLLELWVCRPSTLLLQFSKSL